MGDAEGMIEEAVKYDGYLETPDNWTKFGKAFGWDGVSWCHIYLSVCAKWSGNGDVIPWTASCWSGVQWFKKRGQFFRRGEKTPKPGDIVYYGSAGQDHVGLVVSVSGGKIHTIEGNTSKASGFNPNGGGVHRKEWSLSYSRIYGYGRPAYEEDDMPLSKEDVQKVADAVWNKALAGPPGSSKDLMQAKNVLRETYGRALEGKALVAQVLARDPNSVDSEAIAKAVLADLTPERIAASIPETIAADVAAEISRRLAE